MSIALLRFRNRRSARHFGLGAGASAPGSGSDVPGPSGGDTGAVPTPATPVPANPASAGGDTGAAPANPTP